ncbi:MAG: glycosyltransferase [Gemmatimonadaceae bacterium]|jgi:glycosyltransferase involved in cell wall biosynthesis|nr:glycosyltransferase [Gemmatimonadaceae bacterium]
MAADDRLTITQIAAPAPVGGLERVVQHLAIGLHRRGHRLRVVAVLDAGVQDHPFLAPLAAAGVPTSVVALTGRGYLQERRAVRRLLAAERPDVVHTHGYRSDLLDGGLARAVGAAVVSTMHGSSRLGGLSHVWEWCQLQAWRHFDGVVAVSQALVQQLQGGGRPLGNLHLIPNAWSGVEPRHTQTEARRRLGIPGGVPVIGYVGRLIPAKGPDVLVDALCRIADRPWHAVLIGDGLLRASLEAVIARAGLPDRVHLVGHLDDATDLYRAFDLFALPSRTEGTPIALFEAMGARLPVVATRVGGVPDVLEGTGQRLVPAEAPEALAQAMVALLEAPEAWAALGAAAHARVITGYGADAWLDRHEALYRDVHQARRGRARRRA